MWEKIRIIFTIPELRQKILLTLLLLAIYRVGFYIPVPVVDPGKMADFFSAGQGKGGLGDALSTVAAFSATQLDQATIFGLGIMPYISASIIFQLLASVYKPLEELQKEGESGRKKINEYTRYATVVLCIFQSFAYIAFIVNSKLLNENITGSPDSMPTSWYVITVMTMTAGTIFLMWLGEQIDEFGIGNGISLLIMAGILARMPSAVLKLLRPLAEKNGIHLGGGAEGIGVEHLIVLILLFVAVVACVVFITQGQRKIPTQSAKHIRGNRAFGGNRAHLPLRVNQAGVMPIIFASSLLIFPQILFGWLAKSFPNVGFWRTLNDVFASNASFLHNVLLVLLIYFFCYFWTAITFNPKEMSENLKSYGSFIPGYRPGRPTADYLEKVMVRITYVGAGFLALVAIAPTMLTSMIPGVDYQIAAFYGGTSLLIAVSVAFDLVQKIDSHLVMRNYRGLLERN